MVELSKIEPKNPLGCTAQEAEFAKLHDAMTLPFSLEIMGKEVAQAARLAKLRDAMIPPSVLEIMEKHKAEKARFAKFHDAMTPPFILEIMEKHKAEKARLAKFHDAMTPSFGEEVKMKSWFPESYFKDNPFLPKLVHPPIEIPCIDIGNEEDIGDAEQKIAPTKEQIKQSLRDDFAKLASENILVGRMAVNFLVLLWMWVTSKIMKKKRKNNF